MARREFHIVLFRLKKRRQVPGRGSVLGLAVFQFFVDFADPDTLRFFAAHQGRPHGNIEMGVLREDDLLVFQIQGLDEPFPKFRQEMQGSAQKGYVAFDGPAAGQAGNGLVHHRLENGSRNVFLLCAFIDQRLDVRFGKNAAACRYWVDPLRAFGEFVESHGIRIQKHRHLVDERAGAAGAGAVHSLFNGGLVEGDLRIFSPQFNGHIRLRDERLYGFAAGNDFLGKGLLQDVGQGQPAGTRYSHADLRVVHFPGRFLQQFRHLLKNVGKMPVIPFVYQFVVGIQHCQLDGSGSHVNADSQCLLTHSFHSPYKTPTLSPGRCPWHC